MCGRGIRSICRNGDSFLLPTPFYFVLFCNISEGSGQRRRGKEESHEREPDGNKSDNRHEQNGSARCPTNGGRGASWTCKRICKIKRRCQWRRHSQGDSKQKGLRVGIQALAKTAQKKKKKKTTTRGFIFYHESIFSCRLSPKSFWLFERRP